MDVHVGCVLVGCACGMEKVRLALVDVVEQRRQLRVSKLLLSELGQGREHTVDP